MPGVVGTGAPLLWGTASLVWLDWIFDSNVFLSFKGVSFIPYGQLIHHQLMAEDAVELCTGHPAAFPTTAILKEDLPF